VITSGAMSAPLPRIVIDNDTPQAVVRAAGMTLLTLDETAARFRVSRRTFQGQLDGVPYLCVGRKKVNSRSPT
jgi:hypothetical protein